MSLQNQRPFEQELYGFLLKESIEEDILGELYLAEDAVTQREVVVHVLKQLVCQDEELLQALEAFAYDVRDLNHINIQQIRAFTQGEDGCILVKEHVDGTPLDEYLDQKGVLDWQFAVRLLKQIAAGLAAIHDVNKVHRDLSPANVIVSRGNGAILQDPGLNQILKEYSFLSEQEWNDSTARHYAAPETVNDDFVTPNGSVDVYSLGLIAYEMLTGTHPEDLDDVDNEESQKGFTIDTRLLESRGVPAALIEVVQKATEYHAIHRYADASAMLKALEAIGETVIEPRVVYHHRKPINMRKVVRFSPRRILMAGCFLALCSLGVYYFYYQGQAINPFEALGQAPLSQIPSNASQLPPAAIASPVPDIDPIDIDSTDIDVVEINEPIEESTLEITASEDVIATSETPTRESFEQIAFEEEEPTEVESFEASAATEEDQSNEAEPLEASAATIDTIGTGDDTASLEAPVNELETNDAIPIAQTPTTLLSTLIIDSEPSGATIAIDGKAHGVTPIELTNVTSSRITAILFKEGFHARNEEIEIAPGESEKILLTLSPINREVMLTVIPWGNLYLDDELISERMSGTGTFVLSEGQHKITVQHPSFGKWERIIASDANFPQRFEVDFRASTPLSISAVGDNEQAIAGELIVNGRNTNLRTPVTIELPYGEHSIEIRADGYEPTRVTTMLDLGADSPEPLQLQLRRQ